jgi:hypothetical protein
VSQRYYTSECTSEKLISILADNPYGICCIRDELAGFLGGMDAYRQVKVDRQRFIEAHDGIPINRDMQKDTHPIAAYTPSLSVIGGIQDDVIRRVFQQESEFLTTGFMARFLMVYPPQEPICWNENEPSPMALTAYERLFYKIISYRTAYTPDKPGIIPLTSEAKSMLLKFQHQKANESVIVSDSNVRYVLNKAGMHAARLCLNLHIVKCAETGLHPLAAVSEETMQQALTLTQWFLNEAERIYAMLRSHTAGSWGDQEAMRIIVKIKTLGGEATASQLKNSIALYHRKGGMDKLKSKLNEMLAAGALTVRQGSASNGRKIDFFSIPTIPAIPIPPIPTIPTIPAVPPAPAQEVLTVQNSNNGNSENGVFSTSGTVDDCAVHGNLETAVVAPCGGVTVSTAPSVRIHGKTHTHSC